MRGSGRFLYRINPAHACTCPVMTGVVNLGEMCRTPMAIHYYPGRFRRRRRRRRRRSHEPFKTIHQISENPGWYFLPYPKRSPH